jgi:hypothetical protein
MRHKICKLSGFHRLLALKPAANFVQSDAEWESELEWGGGGGARKAKPSKGKTKVTNFTKY